MEQTLVLIKPDGIQRGLVGEIITRFERKGIRIRGLKMMRVSQELAAEHYAVHKGKDFYPKLIEFITSGPICAMVLSCPDAIRLVRNMVGATCPVDAAQGTIRGDYASVTNKNLVHSSDCSENAEAEIALWFDKSDILEWESALKTWFGEPS
jgi:nucleoside-diphosphate kinase